ncbi:MAG: hypothetical protein HY552_01570 [Elusimicrobia bacterium]|nr:hypothetical protein [Elusimicrobiota bacterium]
MAALAGVVALCALVQSVFGVGLLIFGTPALLFLGLSFPEALFHLLPCSILVSALQLRDDSALARGQVKNYLAFLAPAAALGAVIVFAGDRHFDIRPAVGLMLLASASLRIFKRARASAARWLAHHLNAGLAVVGFVHGLTNMGGGLLTALVNAVVAEKAVVRANIALGYLIMAVLQFALLLGLKGPQGSLRSVAILLAVTLGIYASLGRKAFALSSQLVYQHCMTALMVACGALLLR